uniref:Uncharacterized protein n=1 Tax=Arundo donax TaxID=35708 RepID=A0A0A9HH03_ARUDO
MVGPELLKAVVLSTVSILAVPLEASAETCQPANSFCQYAHFHCCGTYRGSCWQIVSATKKGGTEAAE